MGGIDANTLLVLGTFVTAIGGFLLAIITNRNAASKEELESLRKTIRTLQTENDRYGDRLDDLEQENKWLRDWVELLIHQVRGLGAVPVSAPEREKTKPSSRSVKGEDA